MKVKSEREVAQLCPTLSDPMHYSLPGSSINGIFQARVLEWGAIAFSELIYSAVLVPGIQQSDSFIHMYNFFQIFSLMKVKVTQSCPTLCDPVDYTVCGIL